MAKEVVLSIIVCTYNREVYIGNTLAHLTTQTGDSSHWEAIVVDNNSTDNSAKIARQFIEEHTDFNFRYILETQQGLSYARNRGIAEAKGNLISFIDLTDQTIL